MTTPGVMVKVAPAFTSMLPVSSYGLSNWVQVVSEAIMPLTPVEP